MLQAGDELVDIVDEHDTVVRITTRAEMRRERLRHRAVFIAVQSSSGQLLVHQRSFAKDVNPGAWDVAVGGVVASGESYDDAAARELAEEIGVVSPQPTPIGAGTFTDSNYDMVARCYHVVSDGPFTFADGEVIATRWVDRAGLAALLRDEDVAGDSVALVLDLLTITG
ncbi:MAG TPA: NUDIX domain-containing protein [Ilumatobacteraceae bacterium]